METGALPSAPQGGIENQVTASIDWSRLDDGFGHWFAGFLDGEGCFTIRQTKRRKGCGIGLGVGLRDDDAPILYEISARTGVGKVRFNQYHGSASAHPQVSWGIRSKRDCLIIVAILDRYPLRAKKRFAYSVWRQAVLEWVAMGPLPRFHHNTDWRILHDLRQQLMPLNHYLGTDSLQTLPEEVCCE